MVGVLKSWSTTASSNATADSNINYAEGQTPASINDSARSAMAAIKGFANQISAAKTTGGSANAQTLTSDTVAAISTAYAAGMIFCVKAGYTNSTTTPTFNVDGVGAKTIKKGGAQAALAAGDITAGGIYWLAYEASGDCFLLLNPDSGPVSHQPLDATLTALAALSWSSGNALPQFTAADTVSLTLTPSVSSVTVGQGGVSTPSINFAGVTNYGLYYVTGDVGFAANGGVTASYNTSRWQFFVPCYGPNGSVSAPAWTFINDTDCGFYRIGADNIGFTLGGTKRIDYSTTLIDFSVPARARQAASTETSGTLTSASSNKTIQATGGITIDGNVHTAGDFVFIYAGSSSRTITQGSTGTPTQRLHGTSTTGNLTLAARGCACVFFISATEWVISGDVS